MAVRLNIDPGDILNAAPTIPPQRDRNVNADPAVLAIRVLGSLSLAFAGELATDLRSARGVTMLRWLAEWQGVAL